MGYHGPHTVLVTIINSLGYHTMTTERKPGSRGVTKRFTKGPKTRDSDFGNARGNEPDEIRKASTKTKSPSNGFKKRRK